MECKKAQNEKICNCSYKPCNRKGVCCDCLQYHLRSGQLPACCFPNHIERTYDRSIEKFVEIYQQEGKWW